MLKRVSGAYCSNPASHISRNYRPRFPASKIRPRPNRCCSRCPCRMDRTCEPPPTNRRNKPRLVGMSMNWNSNGAIGLPKRDRHKSRMRPLLPSVGKKLFAETPDAAQNGSFLRGYPQFSKPLFHLMLASDKRALQNAGHENRLYSRLDG